MNTPYHVPYYGRSYNQFIERALHSRSLSGDSSQNIECQKKIKSLLSTNSDILMTPSCTLGLEIVSSALNLGPKDEVIVPAYGFVTSVSSLTRFGAKPVFVDVCRDNLCINNSQVKNAINKKTKAVLALNYAGQCSDLIELRNICDESGLKLIEDAAHAFLCERNGRKLGTIGHFGVFSFHDTKVFSSGEGGAIVINDSEYAEKINLVRDKGTNRRAFLDKKVDKYGWVAQGTAGNMNGLSAALLMSQLSEAHDIIEKRKCIYDIYDTFLNDCFIRHSIERFQVTDSEKSTYHIYWLNLKTKDLREEIEAFLQALGIRAISHYPALHKSEFSVRKQWCPESSLPVTEQVAETLLRLPLYTEMEPENAKFIAKNLEKKINEVFDGLSKTASK